MIACKAKDRQRGHGCTAPGQSKTLPQKSPEVSTLHHSVRMLPAPMAARALSERPRHTPPRTRDPDRRKGLHPAMNPRPLGFRSPNRASRKACRQCIAGIGARRVRCLRCEGALVQVYAARQVTASSAGISAAIRMRSRSKSKSRILANVFFSGAYRAPDWNPRPTRHLACGKLRRYVRWPQPIQTAFADS